MLFNGNWVTDCGFNKTFCIQVTLEAFFPSGILIEFRVLVTLINPIFTGKNIFFSYSVGYIEFGLEGGVRSSRLHRNERCV